MLMSLTSSMFEWLVVDCICSLFNLRLLPKQESRRHMVAWHWQQLQHVKEKVDQTTF